MDRRKFLAAGVIAASAAVLPKAPLLAADPQFGAKQTPGPVDDFKIIKNEVKDGVRYVSATPSAKVCSKSMSLESTSTASCACFSGATARWVS